MQHVGDRARAVVAGDVAGGVAAAPDVRLHADLVPGPDRVLDLDRGLRGGVGDAVRRSSRRSPEPSDGAGRARARRWRADAGAAGRARRRSRCVGGRSGRVARRSAVAPEPPPVRAAARRWRATAPTRPMPGSIRWATRKSSLSSACGVSCRAGAKRACASRGFTAGLAPGDLGPPLRGFRVARGLGVAAIYTTFDERCTLHRRGKDRSHEFPLKAFQSANPVGARLHPGGHRCPLANVRRPMRWTAWIALARAAWRSPAAAAERELIRQDQRGHRRRPRRQSPTSASRCSRPRTPPACPVSTRSPTPPAWRSPCSPRSLAGTHPTAVVDRAHRRLAGGDRRLGADGAADPRADAAVRSGGAARRRPPTRSTLLAPTGSGAGRRSAGDPGRRRARAKGCAAAAITGVEPYALAAAIDRFANAAHGQPSPDVVIASAENAAYAMPAAGWAAESGDPILFVSARPDPGADRAGAARRSEAPHLRARRRRA